MADHEDQFFRELNAFCDKWKIESIGAYNGQTRVRLKDGSEFNLDAIEDWREPATPEK